MASTRGSQSAVQELGPRGRVGADSGKYEVRSKNGANGMSDIEGEAAGIAASEPSRGDASETDGQTERSNGREHMSQCGQRVSFNYESCDLVEARVLRADREVGAHSCANRRERDVLGTQSMAMEKLQFSRDERKKIEALARS
ncbi:MAG: hypothetical protein DME56_08565 [Verrucomicrobia bacterium]|nr:MAG: hypothetical protein DME56_08565 [Verrucomicrobiota bacterium]